MLLDGEEASNLSSASVKILNWYQDTKARCLKIYNIVQEKGCSRTLSRAQCPSRVMNSELSPPVEMLQNVSISCEKAAELLPFRSQCER
jgi:hypothetical protein